LEDAWQNKDRSGWRAGQNSMKTRLLNQKVVQFPLRGRDGMTLIEVVIALAITGLTVAGIVSGYIYCSTSTVKDALYMAANGRAMERIEETRIARWDISSYPVVDELVASNFLDQTVTLDMSPTSSGITTATVKTDISQISLTPPVRRIRVDCIWQFQGGALVTNTIETCRAPD
jgi:prepilin-type N-terminal cleavage/methylation domain-containing protein